MGDVRRANPTFERLVNSRLHALIDILKDNNGTAALVRQALLALNPAAVAKYREAIWYLQATYPGLVRDVLPMGPLEKTNAARYSRTVLPLSYDPSLRPPRLNQPPSAWLNQSIEQWLLTALGTKGILLIHLSGFHNNSMTQVFSGRRVVDHINSVLRIGRLCGCDLLCLYMGGNPVCNELRDSANAFEARKTDLFIHPEHMGGRSLVYRNFANTHNNVIVMGFDANICVNANLFGCPERMPDGSFVPPLTSMTNVITSRAVLVTLGLIYPFDNRGEYGVLNGQ